MRDLVAHCLRMRPDRIIIGEVRGLEAFDLLGAWNTGHTGGMSTLHANSPSEVILRLESLAAAERAAVSAAGPDRGHGRRRHPAAAGVGL